MPPCSSPDPVGRNMSQDCIAAESPIPLLGRGIRVQLGSRMLLLSASGMIQVDMGSAPQPRRRSRNNRGSHPCMLSLLMNPDRFPKSIESGELSLLLRRSSRGLRGCMRSDRNPADSCPPHRGSLPQRRHRLRNFLDWRLCNTTVLGLVGMSPDRMGIARRDGYHLHSTLDPPPSTFPQLRDSRSGILLGRGRRG